MFLLKDTVSDAPACYLGACAGLESFCYPSIRGLLCRLACVLLMAQREGFWGEVPRMASAQLGISTLHFVASWCLSTQHVALRFWHKREEHVMSACPMHQNTSTLVEATLFNRPVLDWACHAGAM